MHVPDRYHLLHWLRDFTLHVHFFDITQAYKHLSLWAPFVDLFHSFDNLANHELTFISGMLIHTTHLPWSEPPKEIKLDPRLMDVNIQSLESLFFLL